VAFGGQQNKVQQEGKNANETVSNFVGNLITKVMEQIIEIVFLQFVSFLFGNGKVSRK
jgi:hypothetical protein